MLSSLSVRRSRPSHLASTNDPTLPRLSSLRLLYAVSLSSLSFYLLFRLFIWPFSLFSLCFLSRSHSFNRGKSVASSSCIKIVCLTFTRSLRVIHSLARSSPLPLFIFASVFVSITHLPYWSRQRPFISSGSILLLYRGIRFGQYRNPHTHTTNSSGSL